MVEKKEQEKNEDMTCKIVDIATGYATAYKIGERTMTTEELLVEIYNKVDLLVRRVG